MDSTFEQIGKRLQIAPSTAHHIFSRFRDTGSVATLKLVSSPDQIFRARPADSSKNRVWTLSLRKLGQVYIWWEVNWVIVGVNYIISNQ